MKRKMKFVTLTIETVNHAFYDNETGDTYKPAPEVARILREAADRIEGGHDLPFNLLDAYGNTVGTVAEKGVR